MKKRLLTLCVLAGATLCAMANKGDDLTARYLRNADFSTDSPMQAGICTYAKDVASNNTTFSGMQPVTEWTASNPVESGQNIDARAAGIFAYGKQYLIDYTGNDDDLNVQLFLGGKDYLAPDADPTGSSTGQALGLVGVWTASLTYTQKVTLQPGAYEVQFSVYNVGGALPVKANRFGFISDDGTEYLATNTTWELNTWETMTVSFMLSQTTTGVISLGYTADDKGSGDMPHLFIDNVKILEGDKSAIEKQAVDDLKENGLLPLLEAGDELGVSTSEGWEVYNDDNATLAQVEEAIEKQRARNEAGMTDFTDFFISNAHFALGTPLNNGVCTYDYDMPNNNTTYFGMQPIDMWTASTPSDNVQRMQNDKSTPQNPLNSRASGLFAVGSDASVWLGSKQDVVPATKANGSTEGNVFGFISVWGGTAYYTQSVTLPAGSYTITIPTYNERGDGTITKNLCGFIAEDGTEFLAETLKFPVGSWQNETIKFRLEEETSGVISIGYQASGAGSGSMPHLFIDEFTLMFNGVTDIDPSLLALSGAVRNAENLLYSDGYYDSTLKSDMEDAISAGNALVNASSADAEANTAATAAINTLTSSIRNSMAKYNSFLQFIEGKLTDARDLYDQGGEMMDFAGELSDLIDTYTGAYEDGTYTDAQIDEIMQGFDAMVAEAVSQALALAAEDGKEHSLNITCLFPDKNLGYDNSTVEGWGNDTGTEAFKSTDQVAEVWNQSSFNVHQTLENLPAGVYELQARSFYRTADNAGNYTEYTNGNVTGHAYIYAGGNRTHIINVMEIASSESDAHYTALVGEAYVPNDKASAHYIFTQQADEVNTMNTVRAALTEQGNLTIGVMGENLSANAWVVWEGFDVIYCGTADMNSILYQQMLNLAEEAQLLTDDASAVAEADNKINDACGNAEELTPESDQADLVNAIHNLEQAIEYAQESVRLLSAIEEQVTIYSDYLINMVESSDEDFDNLVNEILSALDGEGFESNEAINAYMAQLPTAWTTYVQYDALQAGDATEENPYDITPAILNASFEGIVNEENHGEYWEQTGDFGYQFGVYENFSGASFDIHQTITGLAQGFYKVRVQGFYRAGTSQGNASDYACDSAYVHNAKLYANAYEVALNNQLEGGSDGYAKGAGEEVAISFLGNDSYFVPNNREALDVYFRDELYWNELLCSVGEDGKLTIGLKKEQGIKDDWTPFDNFQLYYLGTDTPSAVEGVDADHATTLAGSRAAIYSVDGKQQTTLRRGVNIIRSVESDGTLRTVKVMIK